MRILLFSDLHGHAFKPYSSTLENGRNSRLQDTVNILKEIQTIAAEEQIDSVLFGGDLLHVRGVLNVPTFNVIYEELCKLKIGRELFLLVGNHDQANKTGTEHSIYTLGSIATIMDKSGVYRTTSGEEFLDIVAAPFNSDSEIIRQGIKYNVNLTRNLKIPLMLLGHFGVDKAIVGTNFVLQDEYALNLNELNGPVFDQVFLGHYHHPQQLDNNIRYIGATHQHNWGDIGSERGCWVWEVGQEPVFIKLNSAPKFIKYPYFDLTEREMNVSIVKDNFVRITHDTDIDWSQQETLKKTLLNIGARSVEFWSEPKEEMATDSKIMFHPSMDYEEMIPAYIDSIQTDKLDTILLEEMGRDILDAVIKKTQ